MHSVLYDTAMSFIICWYLEILFKWIYYCNIFSIDHLCPNSVQSTQLHVDLVMLFTNDTISMVIHMCILFSILNKSREPLLKKMRKRNGYFTLCSQTVLPDVITLFTAKSNQRTSGPVKAHLTPGPGIYLNVSIHVYSPRAGADNPLGTDVDVNRKPLPLFLFVASFKIISLKYEFKHILNDFIHVYSPRPGTDNPLGTKFWCQQKFLITLPICC